MGRRKIKYLAKDVTLYAEGLGRKSSSAPLLKSILLQTLSLTILTFTWIALATATAVWEVQSKWDRSPAIRRIKRRTNSVAFDWRLNGREKAFDYACNHVGTAAITFCVVAFLVGLAPHVMGTISPCEVNPAGTLPSPYALNAEVVSQAVGGNADDWFVLSDSDNRGWVYRGSTNCMVTPTNAVMDFNGGRAHAGEVIRTSAVTIWPTY